MGVAAVVVVVVVLLSNTHVGLKYDAGGSNVVAASLWSCQA